MKLAYIANPPKGTEYTLRKALNGMFQLPIVIPQATPKLNVLRKQLIITMPKVPSQTGLT